MKPFIYELHSHTREGSTCASISTEELVHLYKGKGYSGVCITEHFFGSNTTVPDHLPWAKRIGLFGESYERACEEGKKIGLDVFFGWEYTFKGTDLLTYGLDQDWLLRNPDIHCHGLNEYCDMVHDSGGFIVHAHPFWEPEWAHTLRLVPRKVDAVEVNNSTRTGFENARANEFAENYGLYKLVGSDLHHHGHTQFHGIAVDRRLKDIDDLIDAIKRVEVRNTTGL